METSARLGHEPPALQAAFVMDVGVDAVPDEEGVERFGIRKVIKGATLAPAREE